MAPRQPQFDPQYLDEHHQRITEFANDYFDDDEERASFIDTLMDRRGYTRTAGWALPPATPPNGTPPAGGTAPAQPSYFKRTQR